MEKINRKILTVSTPADEVLDIVKAALVDDSYQGSKFGAQADNYGTGGRMRYHETGTVDGVRVDVWWDTSAAYDEWDEACGRYTVIMCNHGGSNGELRLRGDETLEELEAIIEDSDEAQEVYDIHKQYNGDPRENGFWTNDESNNCDWDNPVRAEIAE